MHYNCGQLGLSLAGDGGRHCRARLRRSWGFKALTPVRFRLIASGGIESRLPGAQAEQASPVAERHGCLRQGAIRGSGNHPL